MMEILHTAAAFALAGVMLAIMLLACFAVLAITGMMIKTVSKLIVIVRAHYRYIQAKKRMDKLHIPKEDI